MEGGFILKHIIMYSAGAGSDAAARRVLEVVKPEDMIFLFTDTLVEDRDSYRFMIESIGEMMNAPKEEIAPLLNLCQAIPDIKSDEDIKVRKHLLARISILFMHLIPQMKWIIDGRTPWDIFFKKRFLGNSRLAQCSHMLKQETADKWIRSTFDESECLLYIGIDWTAEHRKAAPVSNWAPYSVVFPMTEEPYLSKEDMLFDLDLLGIEPPRLYAKGFSHNNCAGGCVRGGQAHWKNLLLTDRDQYLYHENKEKELRELLDKDVTILKKETRQGAKRISNPLTLEEHRLNIEAQQPIDEFDFGGCGCFVSN